MLVHNFLENSAQRFPEQPAVWFSGKWKTYAEIEQKANQCANFLVQSGVKRGDRIAILSDNSFNYVILYYAILKSGAITVELNNELMPDDIAYLMNDSGARGIFVQKKYNRLFQKALPNISSVDFLIAEENPEQWDEHFSGLKISLPTIFSQFSDKPCGVRSIDLDLASIVYTSGSTGKPKGVMLSHLNLVTNTRSIVEYLELTERDRIMVILPFYYVYGKTLLNTHFFAGGSVVIDNRFVFPSTVLKTMQETECTGFAGVPSTFSILLHKTNVQEYQFPALRYVTQAGGAMAPSLQKQVAFAFYPAQLYIMYGATEASARLSYLHPRDLPRKWGSIGKAIPNVELFVADEHGKPLPPGQTGELVARGANIMQGYWNDEAETRRVLRNGLYFTGDLGVMDEEGFLYVVGRSKDMIKVGANRISAKEIEEKLVEFEPILEIAVVGIPDEILGEAIKAFIVPKDGVELTKEAVIQFARSVLPSYKIPREIEFVKKLPKNKSGKIIKHKLKKEAYHD